MKRKIVSVLAAAVCSVCCVQGAVFRVDPSAKPGGDGSKSRPFASSAEALAGVRFARGAGKVDKADAITVLFAPGDYVIWEEMIFDARDGGDFGFKDPKNGDFRLKPGAWLFREMPVFVPFVPELGR